MERVDVQHMETMGTPNVAGTVTFDSVAIVLTDGRKIAISELGPAEEVRDAIIGGGKPTGKAIISRNLSGQTR